MVFEEAVVAASKVEGRNRRTHEKHMEIHNVNILLRVNTSQSHGIEATCASPNGIEAKCASPRWHPNPEIDWHRDRYPRDMINPAGRNHVNRQRSPSSNAINKNVLSTKNDVILITS